ncbi:DNA polymerase II [Salinivibrio sp. VYel1]|uniref:DNA polymerase II n=1 Tax=Salinivibrio sp. VYel1 TaxID=2490490 RepID=UPI00128DAC52|nr:DNA polymerase II [Salinivibrio sp. VYel1]MPX90335.1 DNA polymerase II [Salinivibrio sp. VYel1]
MQQGFVITRQQRDRGQTTSIVLWLSTPDGPVKLCIDDQQSVFFVPQEEKARVDALLPSVDPHAYCKAVSLSTFQHTPVAACYFSSVKRAQEGQRVISGAAIPLYEGDIRLADRYLMERYICGSLLFTGQARQRQGYLEVTQGKAKQADYTPTLHHVSLDIECSQKGQLYSVGLASEKDSRVIMVGSPQDNAPDWIEWVDDEEALLSALERWFAYYDPDVVVGWNVIDFDFRLLVKRAHIYQRDLRLGRGGERAYWRDGGSNKPGFISLSGRVVIDGIDALKTATYGFRSWALEAVAQTLLGEGKAIDNPHDRMASINRMFHHDKVALATYNLQDCVLVNRIFAHTHLLDFLIERSRLTGVELDRVGGSVAAFTNLFLPRLHRSGYVAPNLASEGWIASPGGYVMDSKPGLYHSVLVLDFKSLYPSIIRTFLIDPLGLIEGLKAQEAGQDADTVPGFRGGVFHREKHYLPALIDDLWQARDRAKKAGEKAFSQAIKIIMNSFYGVLGSQGCRFFDHRLASSITMRGHEIMKTTRELIEAQGFEVIYGDTDSTFVSLGGEQSSEQADRIGQQLVSEINRWWQSHLRDTYGLDSALEIEYETHYQRFLMPTIRGQETGSKKRYAGRVVDRQSGEATLVFKGLETVRTDWTPLAQTFQKQLYQRVFDGDEVDGFIREIVERTNQGEHDDALVYRKRLRRPLAEYQKNVPPHVRAARMAESENRKLGRPEQYQRGGWIEYVITVNGPEPCDYLRSPIDYQHYIDKQLKPIADGILPFIGKEFDTLALPQLGLF